MIEEQRVPSGGSRGAHSGRDDRVPLINTKVPAWIPPSAIKRDALTTNSELDDEEIFRRVRGILNKLTPEKFEKLSFEFCSLPIKSTKVVKGVIVLILDKALSEPAYSSLYAQLCQKLDKCLINFEPPGSPINTFRKLLLTVCQHEFDNRGNYIDKISDDTSGTTAAAISPSEADEFVKHNAKKKMLGNVKFIGELGRLDLLSEAILHKCIKTLLEKKKDEKYSDMCEDLECLCKMMPSIGKKLDQGESIKLMDQYFERMRKLRNLSANKLGDKDTGLSQRIKFLLQDCIDLRANQWVPRQTQLDQAPKTMTEVRTGAFMEEMAAAAALASSVQEAAANASFNMSSSYLHSNLSLRSSLMMNVYQTLSQQPNMSLLNAINDIASQKNKKTQQSSTELNGYSNLSLKQDLDEDDYSIIKIKNDKNDKLIPIPSSTISNTSTNNAITTTATTITTTTTEPINPILTRQIKFNSLKTTIDDQLPVNSLNLSDNKPIQNNDMNGTHEKLKDQSNSKQIETNTNESVSIVPNKIENFTNSVPLMNKRSINETKSNQDQPYWHNNINNISNGMKRNYKNNTNNYIIQNDEQHQTNNGHTFNTNSYQNGTYRPYKKKNPNFRTESDNNMNYTNGGFNHNNNTNRNNYNNYNFNNNYSANKNTALGVSKNDILPLNKQIIPLEKVIKYDYKHSKTKPTHHHNHNQHQLQQQQLQQTIVQQPLLDNKPFTYSASSHKNNLFIDLPKTPANNLKSNEKTVISNDLNRKLLNIINNHLMQINTDENINHDLDYLNENFQIKEYSLKTFDSLKDLKLTNEQNSELVRLLITNSLDRNDFDRLLISKLFADLFEHKLISSDLYISGFKHVLSNLNNLESEFHCVKSNLGLYAARMVYDCLITFGDLANLMKMGTYYPLFFLCMQNLHKLKSPEWLRLQLEKFKINLIEMLPSGDKNKERLVQILEDRELEFVYPMLKIESLLFDKIQSNLDESELNEWIESTASADIRNSNDFIQSLVTCIVKNAAEKSVLSNDYEKMNKININNQKQLIQKYQNILQAYLKSSLDKQVEAIYAMQVYASSKGFPKYFLAHLFNQMYDLEIIEEEAFFRWKDEINENYPNKGQALFHLQRWFSWLEEASEESSEDEDTTKLAQTIKTNPKKLDIEI